MHTITLLTTAKRLLRRPAALDDGEHVVNVERNSKEELDPLNQSEAVFSTSIPMTSSSVASPQIR